MAEGKSQAKEAESTRINHLKLEGDTKKEKERYIIIPCKNKENIEVYKKHRLWTVSKAQSKKLADVYAVKAKLKILLEWKCGLLHCDKSRR